MMPMVAVLTESAIQKNVSATNPISNASDRLTPPAPSQLTKLPISTAVAPIAGRNVASRHSPTPLRACMAGAVTPR